MQSNTGIKTNLWKTTVIQIEYNFKGVQKSFSTTVLNKKVIYSASNVCTLKQYTIISLRIPPDCPSVLAHRCRSFRES